MPHSKYLPGGESTPPSPRDACVLIWPAVCRRVPSDHIKSLRCGLSRPSSRSVALGPSCVGSQAQVSPCSGSSPVCQAEVPTIFPAHQAPDPASQHSPAGYQGTVPGKMVRKGALAPPVGRQTATAMGRHPGKQAPQVDAVNDVAASPHLPLEDEAPPSGRRLSDLSLPSPHKPRRLHRHPRPLLSLLLADLLATLPALRWWKPLHCCPHRGYKQLCWTQRTSV